MKSILATSLLVLTCWLHAQTPPSGQSQHDLMPAPASVQFQAGKLRIDPSFTVALAGTPDDRLRAAVSRAIRRLEGRTGLVLPRDYNAGPESATLLVTASGPGKQVPAVDEDESYSITISDRQAALKADTVIGAIRGIETVLQLVQGDREGFFLPAVQINDNPRFVWRGLMIDVGRHYQPMEVLKRNLDGMAAVKLNVLHWHLTEDQGFRIESKKFPKLHGMGSDGQFYTQEQAREIIAYARERGIRVVPEFDMPGHVQSWLVGYPELAAAPGPHQISRKWGIMDAAFDPTREETYRFLDKFIGEMADLFPDAYMHIGGDENNGKWWDANPRIQEFKTRKGLKDNHALQTYFSQRLQKILTKHGKRMMGWDEILQPDLPRDVVVHSWRGTQALSDAAKQGYDGVLSAPYYIDLMRPASAHYVDIIPADSDLTEEQRKHVLGGEATMWSELVSPENIDSRIWPRTAAIAERFWSPASVSDVNDMYRRLEIVSVQLEELGLTHIRNRNMLLRRMVGSTEIGPLQTLVSVVAPVQGYRRQQLQPVGAFTPLTRLIDAATADSAEARHFASMVEEFLSDAPVFGRSRNELESAFTKWRNLRIPVSTTAASQPLLQEAEPIARDLSEIGAAGMEAIAFLSAGVAPPAQWRESKMAVLTAAAKPKAAVEIAILPAARELIVAAAELPSLNPADIAGWRARVKALATPPKPQKKQE